MNLLFKFINKVIIVLSTFFFSVRFLSLSFPSVQPIMSMVWSNQTPQKKGMHYFSVMIKLCFSFPFSFGIPTTLSLPARKHLLFSYCPHQPSFMVKQKKKYPVYPNNWH